MKFEISFVPPKNRSKTISSFPWRSPRIWSNIEAKFIFFWCPELKKKKSVLAKIFSLSELLPVSGRITVEIPHGIYSFHGRSLAACNIFPRGMCSIIFADIYQNHSQLKALCTHPSRQHTLSHLSQLPAIFKIIGFCPGVFPLRELVWCKVLN